MLRFYPPLSLRDISPTRGESGVFYSPQFFIAKLSALLMFQLNAESRILFSLFLLAGEMSDRTEGGI